MGLDLRRFSSGFTLVEILITMAISTIIAMAFATLFTNGMKSQSTVSSMADFNSDVSTVQLILSGSPTDCGKAFVLANGTSPIYVTPTKQRQLPAPVPIPKLVLNGNTLLNAAPGNKDNGWTNNLLLDRIISNPQPNMFLVNLKYTRILLDRTKVIGVSEHLKNFQLYISTDGSSPNGGGKIVSCGSTGDTYKYKLAGIQDTGGGVNIHFAAVNHFMIENAFHNDVGWWCANAQGWWSSTLYQSPPATLQFASTTPNFYSTNPLIIVKNIYPGGANGTYTCNQHNDTAGFILLIYTLEPQ